MNRAPRRRHRLDGRLSIATRKRGKVTAWLINININIKVLA